MSLSVSNIRTVLFCLFASAIIAVHGQSVPFSIGDPTDDEQLYLELINRARANPTAEVQRLIALDDVYVQNALKNVNTNLLVQQFSTNPVAAPLSFNANLINAARAHSQYQYDTGTQTHVGPGTNTLAQRLQAAGYPFYWATENVYAYSQSTAHGHAAFEIDWTGGTNNGGIQSPPSHRDHIHDRRFVEIGIGVVHGTNKVGTNIAVGPQLVTQDFGTTLSAKTYITGVAYYDLNGNDFYDLGEGLSGVTVTVDGVNSHAVTSTSGGYSVPVNPGQNYMVRFDASGGALIASAVSVPTTNNVKLDFKPIFAPSSVTSAPPATYATVSNLFRFSGLAGATEYRARVLALRAAAIEGAEAPSTNLALTTYGDYPTISGTVKATGNNSFHLRHLTDISRGNPTAYPQLIQFVNPFFVRAGARVDFQSRLGIAYGGADTNNPGEVARLEISADAGDSWTAIWSQAGAEQAHGPDNSEKTFNARSVSLANYVGSLVMLRFNFHVNPSIGWFDQPADRYGWYLDDIAVIGAEEASNPTITTLDASATFQFAPANPGNYIMQFAAVAGTRVFPVGPWHFTTAAPPPPIVSMEENITIAGSGAISMKVVKLSGTVNGITIESAPALSGPWSTETGATITGPVNNEYTVNLSATGNARFFRVAVN